MEVIVALQSAAMYELSSVNVSLVVVLSPLETKIGIDITTKQATDSKELDTFFMENAFLISVDVALFRRFFFAIMKSLELMNNIGGKRIPRNIRIPPGEDRIMLLAVSIKNETMRMLRIP